MKELTSHFKKLDWVLLGSAIGLVSIGIISLYSSSVSSGNFLDFQKQLIFFILGLIIAIGLSFVNWRILKRDSYFILILYFFCVLALIGLYFFAPEVRGVRSWYKIGPLSFDPIEITKIVLIILLAKYFSSRHIEMYRFYHIILSGIYVLIPAALFFFQPDLGSVLILIAIWIGILLISGIKIKHIMILSAVGIIACLAAWFFVLEDYQKTRVISFINPQIDPSGISWNVNQAKIAIGSGGFLGKGFGSGPQTQYGFLPEPHTDFIFAAIAEEFGLLGIAVVFILFATMILRIVKIALSADSNFPRFFATGFAILIISHILINIGMNLGILPIVGVPLLFISYGGSSLLAVFLGLGILQSIKAGS